MEDVEEQNLEFHSSFIVLKGNVQEMGEQGGGQPIGWGPFHTLDYGITINVGER
jgi:hypothetical protein